MKLSIVIPAHNEEHRLPPMLEAYAVYFSEAYGDQVERIVAANFCTDRTAEVARDIGQRYPQVQVLEDPECIGKGGAVLLGARRARGEWLKKSSATTGRGTGWA